MSTDIGLLTTAIQWLPTPTVIHDFHDGQVIMNPAAMALFGLEPRSSLKPATTDLLNRCYRDDGSLLTEDSYWVSTVRASGAPLRDYLMYLLDDRQEDVSWIKVNADPVFDNQNSMTHVVATFTNITKLHLPIETVVQAQTMKQNQDDCLLLVNVVEEKLRLKNERIKALIDAHQESAILLDRDGVILEANRSGAQRLGHQPENIVGWNIGQIVPPVVAEARMNRLEEAARAGAPLHFPDQRDGRHYDNVIVPIRDEDDPARYFAIFSRDVTEVREATERLNRSEISLAKAHDLARLANWNWEISTNRVTYSPTFYRLLEINPDDLPDSYDAMLSLVHPEDRPKVRSALAAAVFEEQTFEMDYRLVRADGLELIVHALADVVYDEYLEPVMMVGTIQDITARRRAEEAVQEREARLRAILDTAAEGIITIDESCRIESFNQAAEKIFGYSTEEALGKNVNILMPLPTSAEHGQYVRTYLETGHPKIVGHSREVTGKRKDGTLMPLDLSVSEIIFGNRHVFTGLVRDITEKKQAEEQLRIMATYDLLTGLFNRTHLMERLTCEVSAAKRHGYPLTVCLCDLDHFKSINDTYGHKAGDDVLAGFGRLLKQQIRTEDFAGRYGGEEFVLVLPHTTAQAAVAVIERIREALLRIVFQVETGRTFSVTGSFGLAESTNMSINEAELLSRADQAMYQAKESGRNRYVIYDPDLV